jgi:DNA-directed RNA polymerase specialized sigma24 family protein
MGISPGEVTNLLIQLKSGNRDAESRLVPLVYAELRRIAGCYMRGERPGHTLQATALVHEAYLRLAEEEGISWQNRAHFFGVAANVVSVEETAEVLGISVRTVKRDGGVARAWLYKEISKDAEG